VIFFKAEFYTTEQSNISKPGKVEEPVHSVDKLFLSSYCKSLQKWIKEDSKSRIFHLGIMFSGYRSRLKKKIATSQNPI